MYEQQKQNLLQQELSLPGCIAASGVTAKHVSWRFGGNPASLNRPQYAFVNCKYHTQIHAKLQTNKHTHTHTRADTFTFCNTWYSNSRDKLENGHKAWLSCSWKTIFSAKLTLSTPGTDHHPHNEQRRLPLLQLTYVSKQNHFVSLNWHNVHKVWA